MEVTLNRRSAGLLEILVVVRGLRRSLKTTTGSQVGAAEAGKLRQVKAWPGGCNAEQTTRTLSIYISYTVAFDVGVGTQESEMPETAIAPFSQLVDYIFFRCLAP